MRRLAGPAAALTLLSACGASSEQAAPTSSLIPPLTITREAADPTAGISEALTNATSTTAVPARDPSHRASRQTVPAGRRPTRPTGGADLRAYGVRLACIRGIESGGNYAAVSTSGRYRGAYQFDASTWRGAVTRAGFAEYADTPPNEAPLAVQDAAAQQLLSERGLQPWPTPAKRCQ